MVMFTVAALYKFTRFEDPAAIRPVLLEHCLGAGVTGTLLLAPEGINGTIAGSRVGIDAILGHIRELPGCQDLDWKESSAEEPPFHRMKVRLRPEIVTMRQERIQPEDPAGTYVEPGDWNALISAPDVVVIDTRNDYEVAIGTFSGAIDPGTRSFSEFPDWWSRQGDKVRDKRVAMFCTGGIRCEKATRWLKANGAGEVFHLRGGILKYLEEVPRAESLWRGECFVFDRRVSVGHGLEIGTAELCYGCRRAVTPAEKNHPRFEPGVSCHRCYDEHTDDDRTRFRERHRQGQRQGVA